MIPELLVRYLSREKLLIPIPMEFCVFSMLQFCLLPHCMECRCDIVMSVCLSIRLSNACFVTKRKKVLPILLYCIKDQNLDFWEEGWLVADDPFYLKF